MSDIRTLMIEDMGDGIDRREGAVNRDTSKFHDLVNVQVTPGRKIKRRVPCTALAGTLAGDGAWYLDGKLTVFRSRTSLGTSTVTGLPAGVSLQTIYYDDPPSCLGSESYPDIILEAGLLGGVPVALIDHTLINTGSADGLKRCIRLHVFDELTVTPHTKPTYVADGAPPSEWSPAFPQHPYGKDTEVGQEASYSKLLGFDSGRVYAATPKGDVAYSALLRARIFNERTQEQVLRDGEWTYFIPHGDAAAYSLAVPYAYGSLVELSVVGPQPFTAYAGYAEYGVEALQADGTWAQYTYEPENMTPADGNFSIRDASTSGQLDDIPIDAKCTVYLNPPAGWGARPHRFYVKAKPTGTILSGCRVLADGSIASGSVSYRGRTYTVPELSRPVGLTMPTWPGGQSTFIGFKIDDTIPESPTFTYVWSKVQPKDGTVICAQVVVELGSSTPDVGHVSYMQSSPLTVTGSGTNFTVGFDPGGTYGNNVITIETSSGVFQSRLVTAVGSATDLTIDRPFSLPSPTSGFTARDYYIADAAPPYLHAATVLVSQGSPVVQMVANSGYPGLGLPPEALVGATLTLKHAVASTYTARVVAAAKVDAMSYALTMDTPAPATYLATASAAVTPYTPLFTPAYAFQDGGTPFYQERAADALFTAGDGDAGFISSSVQEGDGAAPIAIATAQNRLFVQYPNCVLLYGVSPTSVPTFLSRQEVGAGGVPRPAPQMVDDGLMLPTEFGPRMFFPAGNNKDYLQYAPFGDALRRMPVPLLQAAAWWQAQGVYVTASTDADDGVLWVLGYNKSAKVTAWSRWQVTGLTKISKLIVAGGALLAISGRSVYSFNPAPTVYRDSTDVGLAYKSSARWLYNDLNAPRMNKKLTRLEIAAEGSFSVGVFVSAANGSDEGTPYVLASGYSQGLAKVPILVVGSAVAPYVESTDEAGFELFALGFDYYTLRR